MTEAQLQMVAADLHEAMVGCMKEKHADLSNEDGWTAIIEVSLFNITSYLQAVREDQRDAALGSVIDILKERASNK